MVIPFSVDLKFVLLKIKQLVVGLHVAAPTSFSAVFLTSR
jgi:hypothetical protein